MLRRFRTAWALLLLGMMLGAPLFCDAAAHEDDGDHACACLCHSCFDAPSADPDPVRTPVADRMAHDERLPPEGVPPVIFHPPIG